MEDLSKLKNEIVQCEKRDLIIDYVSLAALAIVGTLTVLRMANSRLILLMFALSLLLAINGVYITRKIKDMESDDFVYLGSCIVADKIRVRRGAYRMLKVFHSHEESSVLISKKRFSETHIGEKVGVYALSGKLYAFNEY